MRRLPVALLALGVIALGIVLLSSGGSSYQLRIAMDNAAGLRPGAAVVVGGAPVGHVGSLNLVEPGDRAIATVDIDKASAPVGRDVSATITPTNLLGQEELALAVGNRSDPAPSGYFVPASRVTPSTDIFQVLNVLDPTTRARLELFLDEAGLALTGRRTDLGSFIGELPGGLADTTQFLNQLVSDNHTLGDLLQSSGEFVGSINAQRQGVTRMVHVLGQTAAVLASRRSELLATLQRTPPALSTLRTFLGQLQVATVPIRPAALAVEEAAAPLTGTLAQLQPFRRAAEPALATASRVAPDLTRLALGATPVFKRARGTLNAVANFSTNPVPKTGSILNKSVDNIVAIVADWGHAIQLGDEIGKIFRGEVSVTPEALTSVISRLMLLTGSSASSRRPTRAAPRTTHGAPSPHGTAPATSAAPTAQPKPSRGLPLIGNPTAVLGKVGKALSSVLGTTSQSASGGTTSALQSVSGLLHYLIGR